MTALLEQTERLYSAFAAYQDVELAATTPTCDADVSQMREVREQVTGKRYEDLSASDLLDYYYLAVNHIGTVNDLRHFLPKILAEMLTSPDLLTPAHLPDLLRAADFQNWPERERDAVAAFTNAAATEGRVPRKIAAAVEEIAALSQRPY